MLIKVSRGKSETYVDFIECEFNEVEEIVANAFDECDEVASTTVVTVYDADYNIVGVYGWQ